MSLGGIRTKVHNWPSKVLVEAGGEWFTNNHGLQKKAIYSRCNALSLSVHDVNMVLSSATFSTDAWNRDD